MAVLAGLIKLFIFGHLADDQARPDRGFAWFCRFPGQWPVAEAEAVRMRRRPGYPRTAIGATTAYALPCNVDCLEMSDPRWFAVEADGGRASVRLAGAWRLEHLAEIEAEVEAALAGAALPPAVAIDGSALAEIDSAAALVLLRALQAGRPVPGGLSWVGFSQSNRRIVEQVQAHFAATAPIAPPTRPRPLALLGRQAIALAGLLGGHVNFLGATVVAFGEAVLQPRRLRLRELTVQLEQTGLAAIPVVSLVTLLIGVVITYLLGLQAEKYGANIFVVDGVGIGATREFAPIIVAVIVAGRSGAAFTAQLGSMRLTEETDAIRTLGLSPMQVLVVPRVLALMIVLPLLVFVGDVMSLLGAMTIAGPMLDIAPPAFLARLREALDTRHVFVGLAKAPVFALFIAVIGTRMGMTVDRDTRALGAATTSTVVQSIVAVILLDAVFAVLMQALDI
jgi:phospholipid/cholesterol/gamma-HCH transport system permease protein